MGFPPIIGLGVIIVAIAALVSIANHPVRGGKVLWVLIVLFAPFGGILWFAFGKPSANRRASSALR